MALDEIHEILASPTRRAALSPRELSMLINTLNEPYGEAPRPLPSSAEGAAFVAKLLAYPKDGSW